MNFVISKMKQFLRFMYESNFEMEKKNCKIEHTGNEKRNGGDAA